MYRLDNVLSLCGFCILKIGRRSHGRFSACVDLFFSCGWDSQQPNEKLSFGPSQILGTIGTIILRYLEFSAPDGLYTMTSEPQHQFINFMSCNQLFVTQNDFLFQVMVALKKMPQSTSRLHRWCVFPNSFHVSTIFQIVFFHNDAQSFPYIVQESQLVGGDWNMLFSISWECHHPNSLTFIFISQG